MLEIFIHKTNPKFYYTRYSHQVDVQHAHRNWNFFLKHTKDISDIKYITEHTKTADLAEKEFIGYMAEYALKFQEKIATSDVFGIVGYRKLFFKTFEVLSKTKFKRTLFNTLSDIENHHGFNFELDFKKIYEFIPPDQEQTF